jgi:RND family efflux transporter MFP subunit|uniref:efflux RND transporter periplasmic adaptor subunit n=1 Tax=Cephaloticoccus sp. TaxID=1985742 RepID=UPI00404B5764
MKAPALFSLLGISVLTGCGPTPAPLDGENSSAIEVRTAMVRSELQPQFQSVSGLIRPQASATVAAKVMGTITQAKLAVGQPVSSGEILVVVAAPEYNARLEQAQAALAQAERDYAREHELEAKGATAAETVRATADRLRLARASLQEAEAMQNYLQVTAPFAGVITGDYVNPGDLATPGMPLFALEGTSQLRAEVMVPESLSEPARGTDLTIMLDDTPVTGRLVELSPAADNNSRTRTAKIALPDGTAARSGQFVRALWPNGTSNTVTIPLSARSTFGQMDRAYVVSEKHVHLRLIKVGTAQDDQMVILAGLDAGESVVIDPPATLRDGQAVILKP